MAHQIALPLQREGVRDERTDLIHTMTSMKPVRAEPVEACGDKLREAQSPAASLANVGLCPSTSSGRTVLWTDLGIVKNHSILVRVVLCDLERQ